MHGFNDGSQLKISSLSTTIFYNFRVVIENILPYKLCQKRLFQSFSMQHKQYRVEITSLSSFAVGLGLRSLKWYDNCITRERHWMMWKALDPERWWLRMGNVRVWQWIKREGREEWSVLVGQRYSVYNNWVTFKGNVCLL